MQRQRIGRRAATRDCEAGTRLLGYRFEFLKRHLWRRRLGRSRSDYRGHRRDERLRDDRVGRHLVRRAIAGTEREEAGAGGDLGHARARVLQWPERILHRCLGLPRVILRYLPGGHTEEVEVILEGTFRLRCVSAAREYGRIRVPVTTETVDADTIARARRERRRSRRAEIYQGYRCRDGVRRLRYRVL